MEILFWYFDLTIPIALFIIGILFKNHSPKKINKVYGYCTRRSMKSQEAWDYANKRLGEIWGKLGAISAVLIVISKIFTPLAPEMLSLIHAGVGMVILFIPMFIIEHELKNKFD